jgi:Polyketide cyclase / dehydrase and lipid transport
VQISVSRNSAARSSDAFAVVTDIASWPGVISSIKDVEVLAPGPLRVGTRLRIRRIVLGHETTEEMEIAEIERPRRLRLAGQSRDLHYERDHIIDAMQTGSRLTLIFRPKPTDQASRAMLPFMTPFMDVSLRDELEQDLVDLAAAITAKSSEKFIKTGRT